MHSRFAHEFPLTTAGESYYKALVTNPSEGTNHRNPTERPGPAAAEPSELVVSPGLPR